MLRACLKNQDKVLDEHSGSGIICEENEQTTFWVGTILHTEESVRLSSSITLTLFDIQRKLSERAKWKLQNRIDNNFTGSVMFSYFPLRSKETIWSIGRMLDLRAIPSIPVYHLFLKRILFHFPIDNCHCILFSFLPSHLFLVFYLHASPEPAHLWDMGGNRSSGGKSKDCELRFESLGTIAQNSFPRTITQALVWADIIILFCLITWHPVLRESARIFLLFNCLTPAGVY